MADECATCHRTHTGKNKNLLKSPSPQSTLCFTCHDGLGANTDVKGQFSDSLVPQNDNTNRLYYRHDTLDPSPAKQHTSAGANEFGGVSNRHTECGDCHNPHQARGPNGTTTPPPSTGVTASGRLAGVSGVSVSNGVAGAAPTYTFLDGKTPATSAELVLAGVLLTSPVTSPVSFASTPRRPRRVSSWAGPDPYHPR